jgi:hypothetical protein
MQVSIMPPTHPVTAAALPKAGTGCALCREKLTPGVIVWRITQLLSTPGLVQPTTVTDWPPIEGPKKGCAAEGSAKELTPKMNPAIATKCFMSCSHY